MTIQQHTNLLSNRKKSNIPTLISKTSQGVIKKSIISIPVYEKNSAIVQNFETNESKIKATAKSDTDLAFGNGNLTNEEKIAKFNREKTATKKLNTSTESITSSKLSSQTSTNSSSSSSSLLSSAYVVNHVEHSENLFDLVVLMKKYLKKIEKKFSIDDLYSNLNSNVKFNGYRNFTLNFLDGYVVSSNRTSKISMYSNNKDAPSSLPVSQLQAIHPIRSISQMKKATTNNQSQLLISNFDLNSKMSSHKISNKPLEMLFRNISIFKSFYLIIQREFINPLIESSSNSVNYLEIFKKHLALLMELNGQLNTLLNDPTSSDISILSVESELPSKYQEYKHGEYILRLTVDISFKMRTILKLGEKLYEIKYRNNFAVSNSKDSKNETSKKVENNDSILKYFKRRKFENRKTLPKLPEIKKPIENNTFKPKNIVIDNKNIKPVKKATTSTENLELEFTKKDLTKQYSTDSFIQETDCSSIMSQEDGEDLEEGTTGSSQTNSSYNTKQKSYPSTQTDTDSIIASSTLSVPKPKENISLEEIDQQVEIVSKIIHDLNAYLNRLVQRTQRCEKLERQLYFDKDQIKKLENSLNNLNKSNTRKSNEKFKIQLEKQLEYLNYRFKLNAQDFNVEKLCEPDIQAAILDTEQKLISWNTYLKSLNQDLLKIKLELAYKSFLTTPNDYHRSNNNHQNNVNHHIHPSQPYVTGHYVKHPNVQHMYNIKEENPSSSDRNISPMKNHQFVMSERNKPKQIVQQQIYNSHARHL